MCGVVVDKNITLDLLNADINHNTGVLYYVFAL